MGLRSQKRAGALGYSPRTRQQGSSASYPVVARAEDAFEVGDVGDRAFHKSELERGGGRWSAAVRCMRRRIVKLRGMQS